MTVYPADTQSLEIKKTSSGICHCPGGRYYKKSTRYKPFDTLEACLASGGREPKSGQGTCSGEPINEQSTTHEYSREDFGGWLDLDKDCQNTRHEILIETSLIPVEFTENTCRVLEGYWYDPYTGEFHSLAKNLDIDHVVPLYYAWMRGADLWDKSKRYRFSNDPYNLLPVEASINRGKGASGPLKWLPPNEEYTCQYLTLFFDIASQYELALPTNELEPINSLIQKSCDDNPSLGN